MAEKVNWKNPLEGLPEGEIDNLVVHMGKPKDSPRELRIDALPENAQDQVHEAAAQVEARINQAQAIEEMMTDNIPVEDIEPGAVRPTESIAASHTERLSQESVRELTSPDQDRKNSSTAP